MIKYISKLVFLCLLLNSCSCKYLTCKQSNHTNECIFEELNLNKIENTLKINTTNSEKINKLTISNSSIDTFPDVFCKSFPNLQELFINEIGMERFAPKSLHQCKNLISIQIEDNYIEFLDDNLFEENPKLTNINFNNVKLSKITGKLFENTPNLEYLKLGNNFLLELPLKEFPLMKKVKFLDLHSNNLIDLDENDNLFTCDRLKIIFEAHKKKFAFFQFHMIIYTIDWFKHHKVRLNSKVHKDIECYEEKDQKMNVLFITRLEGIRSIVTTLSSNIEQFFTEFVEKIDKEFSNFTIIGEKLTKELENSSTSYFMVFVAVTSLISFIISVALSFIMWKQHVTISAGKKSNKRRQHNVYYDDQSPSYPFESKKSSDENAYEEILTNEYEKPITINNEKPKATSCIEVL